jgi:cell wall-associated NlpC family hydrolase
VESSPAGRHWRHRGRAARGTARSRRAFGFLSATISVAAAAGLVLPPAGASAAGDGGSPTLKQLLAEANKLSNQIDVLGQQYDALRIQYADARQQVRVALLTVKADERLLAGERVSIAQIAAAGFMTGGLSPTMQLLQSSDPQALLNRAAILTELQRVNGDKINLVTSAKEAATRSRLLAIREEHLAAALTKAMAAKVAKIQAKEAILNSAAFAKALAIFQQTGKYPNIHVVGDTAGVQALRFALTRIGDPYVWGAAGPTAFDCSGLVVWSFAQIGISLPHFSGDLWNSGVHVPRSQLEPGDLVFFFASLSHVGIYIGNGLMIDAPTWGIPIGVHQIFWGAYAGAVRIA